MTPTQNQAAKPDLNRVQALRSAAQEIADRLDWHRDRAVQAAFVIGSVSAGDADDKSDIDVVVVTDRAPSRGERLLRYRKIGCHSMMLDFFHSSALALASNVAAIDKVTYRGVRLDLCYCNERQAQVYGFQNLIVIKPSRIIECLHPQTPVADIGRELVADRITYDLRIIEVHRRRYLEQCERAAWLRIDLSVLLAAIRDVLLVLNGVWRYNERGCGLWRRLAETGTDGNYLIAAIEDIKQLDDRVDSSRKLSQIDYVIACLRDLCLLKGISVGNFYADTLDSEGENQP